MREKELFLCRQKRFRGSNHRAQGCRHLKTDQDKDEAPNSEMTSAPRAKKTGRRVDQTQAETDADHPKSRCSAPMKGIESVDCEKIHATGAKPINKIELKQTAAKSAPQTLPSGASIPPRQMKM